MSRGAGRSPRSSTVGASIGPRRPMLDWYCLRNEGILVVYGITYV